MKQIISFCTFLILFLIAAYPPALSAADIVTVAGGQIENFPEESIVVDFARYFINGVPVFNTKGERVAKELLKQGQTVEIFFVNNRINSVVIRDDPQE